MTKKEFLHQLKIELSFYLSSQERQAVIEDYAEYFDSALDDGKSEEEICIQLGDVKKLAEEITDNGNKKKFLWIRNIAHKIDFICKNSRLTKIITILPAVIGLMLWIKYKGWIFWSSLGVWANLNTVITDNITGELMYAGQSAMANINFFILAFISLSLTCLVWSNRNFSLSRIFHVPFYIGVCVSLGFVGHLLKSFSEPRLFSQSLLKAVIPLLCGMIISAILFLKLTLVKRNDSKNDGAI